MRVFLSISILIGLFIIASASEKVYFYANDSLKITADLYLNNYELPFILLFHDSEGSRGEYLEIAQRFLNLGYNCMAVDLRVGNKSNYISNETSERARNLNVSRNFIDCKKDIIASIEYVEKFNDKSIILFGSSFSASLCLLVAKENHRINSVIAFSPGEFFRPEIAIKDEINNLSIPVFVSSTIIEYEYILELLSRVSQQNKTIFKPKTGNGLHGTKMLSSINESSKDCWLDLLLFFKRIKNN
jgi:hypothetical protein